MTNGIVINPYENRTTKSFSKRCSTAVKRPARIINQRYYDASPIQNFKNTIKYPDEITDPNKSYTNIINRRINNSERKYTMYQ